MTRGVCSLALWTPGWSGTSQEEFRSVEKEFWQEHDDLMEFRRIVCEFRRDLG